MANWDDVRQIALGLPEVEERVARARYRLGDWSQAAQALQDLLKSQGSSPPPSEFIGATELYLGQALTDLAKPADAEVHLRRAVDELVQPFAGQKIDKVVGIEARGFILGGAVAHQLSAGFVPLRKKGKLPHKTVGVEYALEYGTDTIEMHLDALVAGERAVAARMMSWVRSLVAVMWHGRCSGCCSRARSCSRRAVRSPARKTLRRA